MKKIILAPNETIALDKLKYPMYASPKYDGHRLIIMNGKMFSRNGKPQPNKELPIYLSSLLKWSLEEKLVIDGELYVHKMPFNELQSMLRKEDSKLNNKLQYYIFDILTTEEWENNTEPKFDERYKRYLKLVKTKKSFNGVVFPVPQVLVLSPKEASDFFNKSLKDDYEGMMLRNPVGFYKHGRCTIREQNLLKFKEWVTVDAVITGFTAKQKMKQDVKYGPRTRDIFGSLKRSGKQADFEEVEEIGSAEVELPDGLQTNVNFAKEFGRLISWDNKEEFIGKHVEIKYMKVGTKDKPRFGLITRMRPELD